MTMRVYVAHSALLAETAEELSVLVGGCCQREPVEVTEALVSAVPELNIRIPLDEFADMWRAAEPWYGVWLTNPRHQGLIAGTVEVCRWLAQVSDRAPVTGRRLRADWESIEDEVGVIGHDLDLPLHLRPPWMFLPIGRGEGVVLAVTWAWLGGELPIHYFDFPTSGAAL